MNSFGIAPPTTLSMNSSRCSLSKRHLPPLPATCFASASSSSVDISCMSSWPAFGSGCTVSFTWPYWPRPPVCLMYLCFGLGRLQNRFAVRHLRPAHVRLHVEFAHHAVDDDFEVQLAHARKSAFGRYPGPCARGTSDLPAPAFRARCPFFPDPLWSWVRSLRK